MDKKIETNKIDFNRFEASYSHMKGKIKISSFTEYNTFKQYIFELYRKPAIIIMSAGAADSNKKFHDGDLISFLKEKRKYFKIYGVIIFCQ